jgi:hypothetical protein
MGLTGGILLGMLNPLVAAQTNDVAFGFKGPEIFPIDPMITHLRYADVDGDGLRDAIVVNNLRSRINILFNQTGKTNLLVKSSIKPEINELPPDARFRIGSVSSEKRIAELVVTDLNGDKKPDLAYFGDPKELVVQYNLGSNLWSAPKRWVIEDGQLIPNSLVDGDLNGDGLPDLLVLGENRMHAFLQKPDQTLAEPIKIPFTGVVKSIQVLDIDGDGREDLLLSNWDSPNPLKIRFQDSTGQFGPEIYFALPPIRSFWADDLDGDRKTEIVTIAQNSGRAQVSKFMRKPGEQLAGNMVAGQFQVLPLNKTSKAKRGSLWADVNADQLPDLIVAEPESGQVTVYLQMPNGTLAPGKTFSTLSGVTELAVADWDGDGWPEIFLLSPEERQAGVTRFDREGRMPFPKLIPLEGKPLAIAVGKLDSSATPVFAAILDQEGKRVLVLRSPEKMLRQHKLADSFKSNPAGLYFHDVDQDGRTDLVITVPYEKLKILRQADAEKFDELEVAPPGGNTEQPWISRADVDGDGKPELLLAQKNFLRAVVLQKGGATEASAQGWSFVVKDQINGAASNSRIVAATALPTAQSKIPWLFLLDAEKKCLSVCEKDTNGAWKVLRSQALPFAEFNELYPITLAKVGNAVAFQGLNAAGWLPLSGEVWEMRELDGYETPIKDGRLNDVVTGDLNQDGRKDLVFLEVARNYIDIVMFSPEGKLVPANRWQVFEERTFRGRRGEFPEPREAIIADFTGDGKNDLLILVHDRIILYPQE